LIIKKVTKNFQTLLCSSETPKCHQHLSKCLLSLESITRDFQTVFAGQKHQNGILLTYKSLYSVD